MKAIWVLLVIAIPGLPLAQNRVGINTLTPLATLDVNGNTNLRGLLKINDSAGLKGQVLTSRGNDEPMWLNSAYTGGGRFWMTLNNNSRVGIQTPQGRGGNWVLNNPAEANQEDTVDFGLVFTQGSDLTVSNPGILNNYININKTGLYHFEGLVRMFVTGDVDGLVMTPRTTMKIRLFKSGEVNSDLYLGEELMQLTAQVSTGFANKSYNNSVKFSIDIHLEAGTTVAFYGGMNQLRMSASVPLIAMGFTQGGYISGHFISE
jgi:hypothetical protein